jgi:hypothetical protein
VFSLRNILRYVTVALLACGTPTVAQQRSSTVEVYKTPTCGCCSKWVEHLRTNGFTVRTTDLESTGAVQRSFGVPPEVRSCHTASVGGYVVEGHVPAREVKRLLKERPRVEGIAVAGMPTGSPGMEVPGTAPHPYHVVAFDKSGQITVFASYEGSVPKALPRHR